MTCVPCNAASMDVLEPVCAWGDGVQRVRVHEAWEHARISLPVIVMGDTVEMARARQTAAAMCLMCVWSSKDTSSKTRGGQVCRKARGALCSGLAACPVGKWMQGVWRRTQWMSMRYVGVPLPLRAALRVLGKRPRGGRFSGCGCTVMGLYLWRRLQRRFPALPRAKNG